MLSLLRSMKQFKNTKSINNCDHDIFFFPIPINYCSIFEKKLFLKKSRFITSNQHIPKSARDKKYDKTTF